MLSVRALAAETPGVVWLLLALPTCAAIAPATFWPLLTSGGALGVAILAWRNLDGFCVAWLLMAGLTFEMTLRDFIAPSAFFTTIAVIKSLQIALAALCALRFGPRLDPFNPAWVFALIFLAGLIHGLHPGLSLSDSLRSLSGSVAPFAFCFSRSTRSWAGALLRAARLVPVLGVAGGVLLDTVGLRPLFVDSGGMRLAGLGHPAYLAGVCLTALYACLIRLYRDGQRVDLVLLG